MWCGLYMLNLIALLPFLLLLSLPLYIVFFIVCKNTHLSYTFFFESSPSLLRRHKLVLPDARSILHAQKFIDVYFETFGYLHQVLQVGLCAVGTPFGHRGLVYAYLLGQPLIGALVPSTRHSEVSRFLPSQQVPLSVGLSLYLPCYTLFIIGYKDNFFSRKYQVLLKI